MTVQELISVLKKYPEDIRELTDGWECRVNVGRTFASFDGGLLAQRLSSIMMDLCWWFE